MDRNIESAVSVVCNRLLAASEADAELGGAIRDIAQFFLARLDTAQQSEAVAIAAAPEPPAPAESAPTNLPKLSIAVGFTTESAAANRVVYDSEAAAAVAKPEPAGTPMEANLERLEEMAELFALKAEACRWALAHPGEQGRAPQALWERAKGKATTLWMVGMFYPSGQNNSAWEQLARCFDAAAASAETLLHILNEPLAEAYAQEAAQLCATAQSALRSAVPATGQGYDASQAAFHAWLKAYAENRFFIERHMKVEDAAEPAQAEAVLERAEALHEKAAITLHADKTRDEALRRAIFHAKKIRGGRLTDVAHDWLRLGMSVDTLVRSCGVPASNKGLRELLLPILDGLPEIEDDLPGFDACLRAIDTYLTRNPASACASIEQPGAPCVPDARALLKGKRVILLGGDERPDAKQRIEQELELKELRWLKSREHQSVTGFKPHIERHDVALVVLAIRWSSHSYGDVKMYCDKLNIPLVRLTGGYHPNQLASQILAQAGKRLEAARSHSETLHAAV